MGEEYGEPAPFQFFTDHIDEDIAMATREGRRREFAGFAGFAAEDVPDPQDPATFERSKLAPRETPGMRERYRELLAPAAELGPARRRRRATRSDWLVVRAGGAAVMTFASAPDLAAASSATLTARCVPMSREVWPGEPFPLGATWDGEGTNFSLFSENAERVELCLFDDDGAEERVERRASTPRSTGTATCPASARASATATASTGPTRRRRATASTRPSC